MSAPPTRAILPVVIGIALTIVLLAGLGYLANLRRNAQPKETPSLTLLEPTEAPADSPLTIRLRAGAPLELTPNGWTSGHWHLHARINDIEFMPAAQEIQRDGQTYIWTLPAIRRGPLTIHLGWADQRHREIPTGRTPAITTTLR